MNLNFDFQFDKPVIGIDEVGRGSWAGPVVASAALINNNKQIDKRLDDSKKLPPKIRKDVFENLIKYSFFGVGKISNYEIDKIGIVKATFKAMELALCNLLKKHIKVKKPIILIDGTMMPVFKKSFNTELKLIKKGDTISPSIAAASVLAKCTRDNYMIKMDKIFSGYGFSKNMGYGTRKHKEKLLLNGPTRLHRMTFKPMYNLK